MTSGTEGPMGHLFRVGGPVERTVATLRISGDDLIPEEITRLLRCEPTGAVRKGEQIDPARNRRRPVYAPTGIWRLESSLPDHEPLDAHVHALLAQVSDAPEAWFWIAGRYEADLFVGLFLSEVNQGLVVSADMIRALGERRIALGFDIYAVFEPSE